MLLVTGGDHGQVSHLSEGAPPCRFWLLWKTEGIARDLTKTEGIARDLTQNIHSAYAKRKGFRCPGAS